MLIHALYDFLLVPKREIEARLVTRLCLFAFRCPGTLSVTENSLLAKVMTTSDLHSKTASN
jgi:hypothetical protein